MTKPVLGIFYVDSNKFINFVKYPGKISIKFNDAKCRCDLGPELLRFVGFSFSWQRITSAPGKSAAARLLLKNITSSHLRKTVKHSRTVNIILFLKAKVTSKKLFRSNESSVFFQEYFQSYRQDVFKKIFSYRVDVDESIGNNKMKG